MCFITLTEYAKKKTGRSTGYINATGTQQLHSATDC